MKFLSMYKTVERNTPPTAEELAAMGKLIEQGFKEGWLLATEGCLPSALGARVRRDGPKITVTDGPFTESKEVIGGYWMIDVKSREEAIAWARRCPAANNETIEIRQVMEMADFPADVKEAASGFTELQRGQKR